MANNDSIIKTKLRLPLTRLELVPRPRLQSQIAKGLSGPLTLITAPAGFGKTTLVASSLRDCGMPIAWLSLDKNDNQIGRFINYLIAALQTADPRIGNEAAQMMNGIQHPSAEAVLTSLINDIDSTNIEVILVLDDYQLIHSQAVHEAVTFIIEHCPHTFHLVMATRSDPPLPLSRLRAGGQTTELRAADLRFTPSEVGTFLNDIMGLRLEPAAVDSLDHRTEGWIAGLQMAAISLRDRSDALTYIQNFSGTNRYILDYLLEEVLAHQPQETQRFLLYTSILERFTAPLCNALLTVNDQPGFPGSIPENRTLFSTNAILDYLDRENLFLIGLDDARDWFRYHHLFADLLKARLLQTYPNQVAALHVRAAEWLEQNGNVTEALQHLLAANEIDAAANLIERYGNSYWLNGDLSVALMAEDLPVNILLDHPIIGISLAWLWINQGQIGKAMPLLKALDGHLSQSKVHFTTPWVLTIVRLALAFLGQRTPTTDMGPLADDDEMERIPANEIVLHDAADILYGMALARRGDHDRAVAYSEKRLLGKAVFGTNSNPSLVPFLATMYLFQGRLQSTAEMCKQYLDPIMEKGILVSSAGNLEVVLGNVYYEWNQLEIAERTIREGLRANKPWGNIMTNGFGLLVLTEVLRAAGDYSGALQTANTFISLMDTQFAPVEFYEPIRTLTVSIQLASGDLSAAAAWAKAVPAQNDFQIHPDLYSMTLARIYLALGKPDEAVLWLEKPPALANAGNRLSRRLEYDLLRAVALAGLQKLPESFAILGNCLALAEAEGYIRVFINLGKPGRDLVAAYVRSDAAGHKEFAQRILEAFSIPKGPDPLEPASVQLIEPLSEREKEVLHLMADGKTNQDIAGELIVARGTIKAHAASIYRKLDAANRTEAVARARQLGILK